MKKFLIWVHNNQVKTISVWLGVLRMIYLALENSNRKDLFPLYFAGVIVFSIALFTSAWLEFDAAQSKPASEDQLLKKITQHLWELKNGIAKAEQKK